MIGGIVRKPALHSLLVNAILIAGSLGIYASDLSRNRRDASCSSCSRDSPAALANWEPLPPSRAARLGDAESAIWYSGKGQSQLPQYRTKPFSFDPLNPYYGAARGRGGAEVSRAWSTGGREGSLTLQSGDIYPDLAPASASPFYNIKPPNPPVAPFPPRGPVSRGPFQPLVSDSSVSFQPLNSDSSAPFQPLGPDSSAPFQPLGPVSRGPFQPLVSDSSVSFQPLKSESSAPFQPLGPVSRGPFQPVVSDSSVSFQPLNSDSSVSFQPLSPDSSAPFQPLSQAPSTSLQPLGPAPGTSSQSFGSVSNGPLQPLSSDFRIPFQPFGPGSNGPFQPLGPVSKSSIRKLDLYDLAKPKITTINRGYLNYDNPVPQKSIFEDPETRTSVIFRADKYNDDSDEEDPVPLYPSDYPRKQFDRGMDVFEVRKPVQLSITESIAKRPRGYGGRRIVYGGNYRLDRPKDGLIVPQKDLLLGANRKDFIVGQPQTDQTQDPRIGPKLRNFPENPSRESRMAQNDQLQEPGMTHGLEHVQGNQPRDSRIADRFDQYQEAQPRDYKMADRFVQGDQSRNSRMADTLIQPQEKPFRTSSIMQVPETGFASQRQLSEQDILNIMQQVGDMVANRSTAEEQKRGQQEVQVSSDHADKSLDSPRKEEVKEKRDTVDEEKVPVNVNDEIYLSPVDYRLPEDMTTQTLEMDIKPVA